MSHFLPSKLLQALKRDFSIDTDDFIRVHESDEQITSIRLNPAKPTHNFDALPLVPWCREGHYLNERPSFTLDPLFHAGAYYVQEASSMFIAHILKSLELDQHACLALDLCAAPGGKSTLLNSGLHPDSLLVSNEIIKTRVGILADNLSKWGNHNVVVTNNDPASFQRLPGFFDLVLIDAPCSGSGMFRKDKQTIQEWSMESVNLCSQRQQRILSDSLSALKEDGILIYSTCSYSIEENELIADWLVEQQGMRPIAIPFEEAWGIEETASPQHRCPGYRFYPNKVRGEGLYIACFRKTSPQHSFNKKKIKFEKNSIDKGLLANWISAHIPYLPLTFKEDLFMIPPSQEINFRAIQAVLYLKKAGTLIGKLHKKDLLPHPELALSTAINPDIPSIDLPLETAQNYLRKAEITLPTTCYQQGWALMTYQEHALGWAKVLPNRINNYYPKEWRILHL